MAHIDYTCADQCCNPDNEYKIICQKCGMCGRKFNILGVMTDKGGTTIGEEE